MFHGDRQTDGNDEANRRFSQFCKSAWLNSDVSPSRPDRFTSTRKSLRYRLNRGLEGPHGRSESFKTFPQTPFTYVTTTVRLQFTLPTQDASNPTENITPQPHNHCFKITGREKASNKFQLNSLLYACEPSACCMWTLTKKQTCIAKNNNSRSLLCMVQYLNMTMIVSLLKVQRILLKYLCRTRSYRQAKQFLSLKR